ncbi:trypsin-like peptidase domain-containing protein [Deinococcus radiomollis]|uniref:S1C family serine protease n=1 Tax=Deinococcus radiomollis TaxID=468916 RepID=UPI0038923FFA
MNSHFNKYWPLLALPVAAAIVAVPHLPGPAHSAANQSAAAVPGTSTTPNTDTAQNAQPQTFGTQTPNTRNDAQSSPFNDPNWNPLANDNGAGIPDVTDPYAQRAPSGAGDSGSRTPGSGSSGQNSAATAALRKVYQASVSSAVRVNVGDSGIGSGFFMSPDGLILTAAHVPLGDSSAKLSVTTGAGQSLPVTLVGYDEVRDLAVLKAEGSNFPALKLADSTPKVGAGVVAIGNSRGSFDGGRAGAVTALNVSLDPTFPVNMVESSMPLAPGDSGGPVLNAAGEVVGVSTAISNQNGSFASYFVPVTRNSALVQSLVSGVKRGVPVLGIGVADARATTGQPGVLVTAVTPGLGAAKAGLKGGTVREFRDAAGDVQQDISGADIIVGVDGQAVTTPAGLIAYLRGKSVGDRVTLKVQRGGTSGGQTLNVPVVLSAKPVSQG